jgi:hypothetical protein
VKNTIEQLYVSGNHRDVGLAIGRRFGDKIHSLFDNYGFLQARQLPFHRSSTGRTVFQSFLALHHAHFPDYVAELEGIAQGADRSFDEVFLVNLRGEYRGLMELDDISEATAETDDAGCTDCLVLTSDAALIGHNEDGTAAALGNMLVLHAQVDTPPPFSALCYPGFLPGNAFGFNASGVIHTVDAVSPCRVRVGLGRHFLARSILDASSLSDAIRRVTIPGRAAGFTYNIGSLSERRLVSVEVSPDQHHVYKVQGHYLHTNHYLNLAGLIQTTGPSSRTRLARARSVCQKIPPSRPSDILSLLGDTADPEYPIYRTATAPDGSATLCTALFDLDRRQLRIYSGHPVREQSRYVACDLQSGS